MRILRSLVNLCLRPIASDFSIESRAVDTRILKWFAKVGSTLCIPSSERLGEPWMLDCLRIFIGGIVKTPYGESLSLPYPLVISVSVANHCAIGCSFCYSDSRVSGRKSAILTVELSERIANSPVPIVFITGGEPFHHPRLAEVLTPILDSGKKVIVATNALSDRLAEELLSHRGQITFLLSQWGAEARHDAVRGRGNLKRTRAAAERLTGLGHRVSLDYVLVASGETEFAMLEEILSGAPYLHRVYVSREILVGRTPIAEAGHSAIDSNELRLRMRELGAKFPGRVVPMVPELLPVGGLPAPSRLTRLLGVKLPDSCGAAVWTLHIGVGGECYPCFAHEGKTPFGNLLAEDLSVIWDRARAPVPAGGTRCAAESTRVHQIGSVSRDEVPDRREM